MSLAAAAAGFAPGLGARAESDARPAWVTPGVEAEGLDHLLYDSAAARARVSLHVFRPPSFDNLRSYPTLYWLHGTGGGERGIAPLTRHFSDAMRRGAMPPALIVFPNGLAHGMWVDSVNGATPIETMLTLEIVPLVESTYPAVKSASARLVEGFSMGGYGAARMAFKHADLFGSVSVLAGGPLDIAFAGPKATQEPKLRAAILKDVYGGDLAHFAAQSPIALAHAAAGGGGARPSRLRLAVGARDFTMPQNVQFSDALTQLGFAHRVFVVPEVGHDALRLLQALSEIDAAFYHGALGGSS
jgi:enterochelin esterase-like enzyme